MDAESDSMKIAQAIFKPSVCHASGVVVMDECQKMMTELGRATISHYNEKQIFFTNKLAHYDFIRRTGMSWHDQPPDSLVPSLVNDLIVILIKSPNYNRKIIMLNLLDLC